MEYLLLDYERYNHCGMVVDENEVGGEVDRYFLHARRWDVYMSQKKSLFEGGHSVEVSGSERNKVAW